MLLAFVACGALAIVITSYEATIAHRWPITVEWRDGRYLVKTASSRMPVREFEEIVAVNGIQTGEIDPAEFVRHLRAHSGPEPQTISVQRGPEVVTVTVPLEKGRLTTPVIATLLTLVATLGLLALRSRAEQTPGRREFLMLCVTTSALVLLFLPTGRDQIASPLAVSVSSPSELGWDDVYMLVAWPLFFGLFLARFLVAVVGSPSTEQRWLFGRHAAALMAIAVGGAFAVTYPLYETPGFSLFAAAVLSLFLAAFVLRGYSLWIATGAVLASTVALTGALYKLFAVDDASLLQNVTLATQLGVGTSVTLITLVTIVLWPLTLVRLSRAGRAIGGVPAKQVEVAMIGVRIGAIFFIASMAVLFLGAGWLMRSFFGRAIEMADSWSAAIVFGMVIVLFLTATASPFFGVFLAVTRNGLWNADLLFRRVVIWSSVGALFFALWEVASLVLGALVESRVMPILAPLLAAAILAVARPLIARGVDRLVFPRSRELAADIQRIRLAAMAGKPVMTAEDVASLRASGAAVVILVSSAWALARRVGHGRAVARAVICVAQAGPERRQFIVFEDDEVWFGFRVPLSDGTQGLVLLDPMRGGRLYDEGERRELQDLFELIKDRLFEAHEGSAVARPSPA